jgi:hypothetical protein
MKDLIFLYCAFEVIESYEIVIRVHNCRIGEAQEESSRYRVDIKEYEADHRNPGECQEVSIVSSLSDAHRPLFS